MSSTVMPSNFCFSLGVFENTKDQFLPVVLMLDNYYFRKSQNLNETIDRDGTNPTKK